MFDNDGSEENAEWLDASELDDEPTKRTRTHVSREALRPPPVPREARELRDATPPYGGAPQAVSFVEQYRILERMRTIESRIAKVEKRIVYLGLAVVFAEKLPLDKLFELAKAFASSP